MSKINYEKRAEDLKIAVCHTLNQLRGIGNLMSVDSKPEQELYEKISEAHDQLKISSRKALGFTSNWRFKNV